MNEIELYREDGDNLRSVCVRLDEDEFLIDTQDIWPKVDQFWGDSDYEFWTRGPREAWENRLLKNGDAFSMRIVLIPVIASENVRTLPYTAARRSSRRTSRQGSTRNASVTPTSAPGCSCSSARSQGCKSASGRTK